MVLHYTENSFIVVSSSLWPEIYYNSCRRMGFNCAHSLAETEHIVLVCIKLELSGQIAVVYNVKDTIGFCVNLYFTEMKSFYA